KSHRALDDKLGVITAVTTTNGIRDDGAELGRLLAQHQAHTARGPRAVVADCKYGTTENFTVLARQGIRSHMGDLRSRLRNHHQKDIYPAARFQYDATRDTYQCPAGRRLYRHHFNRHRGYFDYRTRAGVCARCRLAHKCTRSKAGRSLNRYPSHDLLERARRQSHGPAAQRDRQRRQWLQEGNFAEATTSMASSGRVGAVGSSKPSRTNSSPLSKTSKSSSAGAIWALLLSRSYAWASTTCLRVISGILLPRNRSLSPKSSKGGTPRTRPLGKPVACLPNRDPLRDRVPTETKHALERDEGLIIFSAAAHG
ncbi:MAG: transposase, partial [Chthoniobacterales bacterium]